MTREEIIERKRIAHQLKMIEAMGWKKDEIEFKNK
jgi:hypothetical protein